MSSGGVECVTHRAGAGMSEGKALGRTQLKGLLDNLVQKSLEKREDNVDADVEEAARDLLELTDESGRGKKRRHSKVGGVKRKKKRMRKDVGSRRKLCQESLDVPNGTRHTPHVMTLFDRKVDLAKFSPDTPLYVMCREWMSNNPDSSHAPQPTASQGHTLTAQILPLPTPLPMDRDGHEIRIDIPKPHPPLAKNRHEMEKQIAEAMADGAGDLTEYKREHVRRWREVRARWRIASAQNQLRYQASFQVLKGMFQRL